MVAAIVDRVDGDAVDQAGFQCAHVLDRFEDGGADFDRQSLAIATKIGDTEMRERDLDKLQDEVQKLAADGKARLVSEAESDPFRSTETSTWETVAS